MFPLSRGEMLTAAMGGFMMNSQSSPKAVPQETKHPAPNGWGPAYSAQMASNKIFFRFSRNYRFEFLLLYLRSLLSFDVPILRRQMKVQNRSSSGPLPPAAFPRARRELSNERRKFTSKPQGLCSSRFRNLIVAIELRKWKTLRFLPSTVNESPAE